jgi:hypothetical protein
VPSSFLSFAASSFRVSPARFLASAIIWPKIIDMARSFPSYLANVDHPPADPLTGGLYLSRPPCESDAADADESEQSAFHRFRRSHPKGRSEAEDRGGEAGAVDGGESGGRIGRPAEGSRLPAGAPWAATGRFTPSRRWETSRAWMAAKPCCRMHGAGRGADGWDQRGRRCSSATARVWWSSISRRRRGSTDPLGRDGAPALCLELRVRVEPVRERRNRAGAIRRAHEDSCARTPPVLRAVGLRGTVREAAVLYRSRDIFHRRPRPYTQPMSVTTELEKVYRRSLVFERRVGDTTPTQEDSLRSPPPVVRVSSDASRQVTPRQLSAPGILRFAELALPVSLHGRRLEL